MLRSLLSSDHHPMENIYRLDDAKFFRLLNFVDVLVTNDYLVYLQDSRHIRAKLVGMPHHGDVANPTFWNYFYDYFVSDRNELSDFDYSFYSDGAKIHRNAHFTQLVAGHPKIDLILEERQKNAAPLSTPVLLLYPTYVDLAINLQHISPEKYVEIWGEAVSVFLSWCPAGLVVFRPAAPNRHHPVVEQLRARFESVGRFFIDEDDDNKFWLARAHYLVTDYSGGFINFCMTAKKPAIRMVYTGDETEPVPDEWGWTISRPSQILPLLEQMDMDDEQWKHSLCEKQLGDMPTLGQNFTILAGMIKNILNNEDPGGLKVDKGHTPCTTAGNMLKLVARWVKHSPYMLRFLSHWVDTELVSTPGPQTAKIWLLLVRRALLPHHDCDAPAVIAQHVDMWLGNALESLPFRQSVGLVRYLLRKYTHEAAPALLITATSVHVSGARKKRALFFLLMEWARYDPEVVRSINVLAEKMPQHFSRPVLDKLNRYLPLIMKVPRPLRRLGARFLGLKKPLAKKYWQAHRALA